MVNINRKYLDENLRSEAWRKFKLNIERGKDFDVFKKYFTSSELVMIEKRLAILILLERGDSYLEIRHRLDVSPGTISFIKQGFKKNKKVFKSSVNKIRYKMKRRRTYPRYKGTRGFGLAEW